MDKYELLEILNVSPIIAAVKNDAELGKCLESDCRVVFTLYGDIIGIPKVVSRIRESGKLAMVHVDLVDGLSVRDVAVDYIAQNTEANGIITTKPSLVRHAKTLGLLTVQRFFVIDSLSLANIDKQLPLDHADLIEVLPGIAPKIIRRLARSTGKPVIAGGLISEKEDVIAALDAGAIAVSSTNIDVWFM
jgi:glycerol uptake operon antiterminator